MAGGFHGAVESSRNRADGVVLFSAGSVEAQAEALDPMLFELGDRVIGQQRRRTGSDRDFQSQAVGIVDQFIDVAAAEGIASGQDEMGEGIAESDQLLQEAPALLGRKLERIGIGHGFGAAVFACQAASLGHLPVHQQRIFGKITDQAAHVWSTASNCHDFVPPCDG